MNRPWRLIVSTPADGPTNMALDEALFESVQAEGLPFLRFYQWSPATLSLGRFQNPTTGLSPRAATLPRVRRMTGGGGIWHGEELTYSLGCSQSDLGPLGVKASYEKLCGFLVRTWTDLGWEPRWAKDVGEPTTLGAPTPACFAGKEEYDILVGGRKLGGNAQRRSRDAIFQHGSIPQGLDWRLLTELFEPGYRPDRGSTTDLRTCGWQGSLEDLVPLLALSFQRCLGVEWTEGSATAAELVRAELLVEERFGSPAWTDLGSGSLR